MKPKNQITIYEHEPLVLGEHYNGIKFENKHLEALEKFFGDGTHRSNQFLNLTVKSKLTNDRVFSFYSLMRNGVKFCHFVGVLQLDDLIIEVLPKADRGWGGSTVEEQSNWRYVLVKMLQTVRAFDVQATSFSALKLVPNSFLDVYYELFVAEVEALLHAGLIKRYREIEENRKALSGNLVFSKQIQQNLVHKERFYVHTTEYDTQHQLHAILYKALKVLQHNNNIKLLSSRVNRLLLSFPELKDINVYSSTFDKIVLNRKSQSYQTALLIAKMILLNFHPDVSRGKDDVVAIMFNMNALWEQFVYYSIKSNSKFEVEDQKKTDFWSIDGVCHSYFKADIHIQYEKRNYVLDTKWKNIEDEYPSNDDLRQMFAYLHYYNAPKTALIYPGKKEMMEGKYIERTHDLRKEKKEECAVIKIPVEKNVRAWQKSINTDIENWINN